MKQHWKRLLWAAGLVLVCTGLLPEQRTSFAAYADEIKPWHNQWRIGSVEAYHRPGEAVQAGVAWDRIIFEWRYFQPNNGKELITTTVPDAWLDQAVRGKRQILGLIKNAPKWATGSDLLGAPALNLDLPINDPNNYWANYVRKLVSYYSKTWGIKHWIIYNEPDIRPENTQQFEFAGDVEDYYKTLKVAYKAAKSVDPQAIIHMAGLTYWHDVTYERNPYMERLLKLALADPEARRNNLFFDVATVHAFNKTQSVWFITQLFQRLNAQAGFPKPIWIDELNAVVTVDKGYSQKGMWFKTAPDQQAMFIIQGMALGLAAGAERVSVYRFDDTDASEHNEAWGVIRHDGTRRDGFYALQTATRYFGRTKIASRLRNDLMTLVMLQQPDGTTVYVAWNRTRNPITARFAAARSTRPAQLVSITGQVTTIPASESLEGYYDLVLPSCKTECEIEGEPRILIQAGSPLPVVTLRPRGGTPIVLYK